MIFCKTSCCVGRFSNPDAHRSAISSPSSWSAARARTSFSGSVAVDVAVDIAVDVAISCPTSRFSMSAETATTGKMATPTLTAPKRTAEGYYLALTSPITAPPLAWTATGSWTLIPEWASWAAEQRKRLLGELLSHGTWFSKPPRHEVLDPLFAPWAAPLQFNCPVPASPGTEGSTGQAVWALQGLMMSAKAITPVWTITSHQQDEAQDTISLFGDDDAATREIEIEEFDNAPPAAPTRIRSREWEARKFMAKERVREARLKAQIAKTLAQKEESRFYRQFGDLEDAESHFSEYDLTDAEDDTSESSDSEFEDEETLRLV